MEFEEHSLRLLEDDESNADSRTPLYIQVFDYSSNYSLVYRVLNSKVEDSGGRVKPIFYIRKDPTPFTLRFQLERKVFLSAGRLVAFNVTDRNTYRKAVKVVKLNQQNL
jgi:hypothetical protein